MAIGAITMILTNVGLQIYNNWCGSRQNDKLQQKREEFERAARERNTEHMWKLLREGQELTMELEKKKHDERLEELQGELDNLLKEITHEQTIINWPLKVLPIVMKNQAFGNLLANQKENVAMHVLFARSNYSEFNKLVHPIIEKALELHCNQHWSTKSDHPILFYSGAWDTQRCPMNPNDIQITALQTQLSNLPTLLITPFFRPKDKDGKDGKLVFQVNMWGVGASKNETINVKKIIEPKSDEFHFQHLYTNQDDYENTKGVLDWIVEDLVPYLECMIGYMADTYFWSSAGLAPHLPLLVTNGTINTDGMKYLINDSREYYDQLLLKSEEKAKENPFMQENLLNLYEGNAEFWDEKEREKWLDSIFLSYCSIRNGEQYSKTTDAINNYSFNLNDRKFLLAYLPHAPKEVYYTLKRKVDILNSINFDYSILENDDSSKLIELANNDNPVALFRLGELYEYSIGVKSNQKFAEECYDNSEKYGFVLAIYKKKLSQGILFTNDELYIIELLHNSGIQQASFILAEIYWKGLGSSKSIDLACDIMNSIVDSHHPFYYYLASMILLDGYGSEEKTAIFKLLKRAADMGYIKAQEKVMMIYTINDFVPANPKLHFEYAKKAAEQGSMSGITRVGYCLAKGYGIPQSKEQAKKILAIAVKKNYKDAITLMNILKNE